MENLSQEKNSGKKTQKKKLIRVDMTPMVDLGFLLITFFMFTTNFSKPNVMDLSLPAGEGGNKIDIKNSINIILGKENRIFYYQDELSDLKAHGLKETSLDRSGLQKIIENAKRTASKPEFFTVLIKPTEDANYKNFVDVLDEINISQTANFGISEIKEKEEKIYKERISQK
jgi:biopolymer transport protein ExbD